MRICPRCQARMIFNPRINDFEHNCNAPNGDSPVNRESIEQIGPWTDFTGSGGADSRNQQMWAGTQNKLQGTVAGLMGARDFDRNEVGQNKEVFRRRQFIKHDDL